MMRRECQSMTQHGLPCRQAPLLDRDQCFWHDPDCAEEAAAACALGGRRRKQEAAITSVLGLDGRTMSDLGRVLEAGLIDVLSLENTNSRAHAIARYLTIGPRIVEGGQLADQVAEILRILNGRDN